MKWLKSLIPQPLAIARQVHPALPCLLITGYWDSDALAQAGVDCPILRKPFTQDALRAAMAEALAARPPGPPSG